MAGVVENFLEIVNRHGSYARFHREDWTVKCPCRTPEGYRDPEWHLLNPNAPVCNEQGMLSGPTTSMWVKCWVQPIQSTRATRLSAEYIGMLVGEFQSDDHLGIFPVYWNGTRLEFREWSQHGEDFIEYNGRRFMVVNANLFADPLDGNPEHHWEVGLRLMELSDA